MGAGEAVSGTVRIAGAAALCWLIAGGAAAQTVNRLLESNAAPEEEIAVEAVAEVPPAMADNGLSFGLELEAGPALGHTVGFPAGDELIDESSYSVTGDLGWDAPPGFTLKFTPGVSYSPSLLDADAADSSAFASVKLAFDDLRAGRGGPAIRPFLQYKAVNGYDNFLNDREFTEHSVTGGASLDHAFTLPCPRAESDAGCAWRIGYRVQPSLQWVVSGEAARNRVTPKIYGALSIPAGPLLEVLIDGSVEWRRYSDLQTPAGDDRRDVRLIGYLGVDVSNLFYGADGDHAFGMLLGVRAAKNWSNDDAKEYFRSYAVPTLTLTAKWS